MLQITSKILVLTLCCLSVPALAVANEVEPVNAVSEARLQVAADIQINVARKTIHIKNAQGETLEVFNITGVRVATVRIDSPDKQVTLNVEKGLYLLRVGNVTRKVQLS